MNLSQIQRLIKWLRDAEESLVAGNLEQAYVYLEVALQNLIITTSQLKREIGNEGETKKEN